MEIALAEEAGFLRVDVRDNGPGISPEHQEMIFEKFRQAGDPLTGKPQGSGLGLYISRRIIEHSGGRLWVSSRAGRGRLLLLHAAAGERSLARQGGLSAHGAPRARS